MENITSTDNTTVQAQPDNYLAWSIVVTLLCCWPFGIPAIINSAKVDGLWRSGQTEAAILASNNAKKWTKISAIVGGSFWLIYALIMICSVVFAALA